MLQYLELTHLSCAYQAKSGWVRFAFGNGQIHVDLKGQPWATIPNVDHADFQSAVDKFIDDNLDILLPQNPKTKKPKIRKSKKRKS